MQPPAEFDCRQQPCLRSQATRVRILHPAHICLREDKKMTAKATYGSMRPMRDVQERFEKFRKTLIVKRKGELVTHSDALDELLKKAGY